MGAVLLTLGVGCPWSGKKTTGSSGLKAPTNLVATVNGTVIVLTWDDNSDNEDGFKVERNLDDEWTWSTLHSVGANVTTVTTPNPTGGYFKYRVYAFNAKGISDYSNVVGHYRGD
jgi:hypothetical protein